MINILLPSITILFLLFLPIQSNPVPSTRNKNSSSNTRHCVPHERDALLAFRASLSDPGNYLSSWQGEGCCQWNGIRCSNRTGHVVELRLRSLEGVSPSIRFRGGQMSTPLLDLKNLRTLDLRNNNFGGAPIPEFIGGLKSLRYLYISNSRFGGRVPPQIGNLSKLLCLDLNTIFDDSYIYSTDLAWLSRLTTLKYLDLSKVNLSTVPNWVHVVNKLPSLVTLNLRFCGLQNVIPSPVNVNLTSLENLDLYGNEFSSSLGPKNLFWDLPSLLHLDMGMCGLRGSIPEEVGNMTLITRLYLNVNNLTGTIPTTFKNLRNLEELLLYGNSINGPVAVLLERLPTENSLQDLTLFENNLSGNLPNQLRHLRNLTRDTLPSLSFLSLRSNLFSGHIPLQLAKMKGLQYLDLACNNMSGAIPQTLADLIGMAVAPQDDDSLSDIVDYGYNIDGATNVVAYTGSSLVIMKGQQLEFTSRIMYMVNFDLSCNSLTGHIPKEIGKLPALKNLNLSWNHLSGVIPDSIGEVQSLESLDLSHNEFGGEIPGSIAMLTSLEYLNLSYNNLTGRIPSGNQLQTLNGQASIYIGNPGLCGPPLSKNCSEPGLTPHTPKGGKDTSDIVFLFLAMSSGYVMGLWTIFCLFLFNKNWRVACFKFSDCLYDWVYVHVSLSWPFCTRRKL
ncbi:unnamed protein product [Urochloa decumbens]|uniref:Leucine-rich repeat-containing N-terminal plant-type domain-containing protein n=1 Tax=Urochloa decumbens TaxID=240449 RepID=A0ABC8ZN99_9POAL